MVAKTQRGFFAYIRAEQGPRLGGVVTVDGQQVPYGYHGSPDVRGLIETMVAAAYRQFASRPDKGPTKPERNTWAYPSPSLRIE